MSDYCTKPPPYSNVRKWSTDKSSTNYQLILQNWYFSRKAYRNSSSNLTNIKIEIRIQKHFDPIIILIPVKSHNYSIHESMGVRKFCKICTIISSESFMCTVSTPAAAHYCLWWFMITSCFAGIRQHWLLKKIYCESIYTE